MSGNAVEKQKKLPAHPARPQVDKLDLKALHVRIEKRFPKVMAKLAE